MPAIDLSKKKKEFKPSVALHDGKIFIAVEGEPDLVIQGRIRVDRVYKYLEDGGQPVIDPRNKLPMFEIESGIDFKIIPKSEFDAMKKASWGLQ